MDGWTNGWIISRVGVLFGRRLGDCMDGWMDKWKHVCMKACTALARPDRSLPHRRTHRCARIVACSHTLMHCQVSFSCNDHENGHHLKAMLKVLLSVAVVVVVVGMITRKSGWSSSKPLRNRIVPQYSRTNLHAGCASVS